MQLKSMVRSSLFVAASGVLALSGQAMGADRDRRDHSDRGLCRTGLNLGFGVSNYGSSFSIGFGNRHGYRSEPYCAPRPYYAPRPYCPPVVAYSPCAPVYVSRPYCPPPVYVPRYDTYGSRFGGYEQTQVVVERPVYVDRPVVVEREVIVETPAPQPVLVERSTYVQRPAAVEVRPAAPVQATYRDRELGDAYLRMGDPDNAVRVYSRYLTAWNADGTVNRNLGFALIGRGDVPDGCRAVVRGYQLEPSMVQRPPTVEDLGGRMSFERILDGAARAAAGTNTAEAWLTVAILQNVAAQKDAAINALQKSRDAGLDKALLDSFTLELGKQK